MFESFYGFTANPFRMSADEQFRFVHKAYKKAWAYLNYALDKGEGFVLITGRPGTGKTTLIRDTLAELDSDQVMPVNLVSNQLQGEELLRLVALELGIQAQDFDKATLLTRIEHYTLMLHQEQRRVVVIVDEAQNLSANGLEELRLLSNLQVGNQPLFQIVMIGQDDLRSLIYGQAMENIMQRIVATCVLEPMSADFVQGYVEHRLGIVGWDADPTFDPAIFESLYQITQGVPRDINLVMARLLLYGALEEKHQLTHADLITVLKELAAEQRLAVHQVAMIDDLSKALPGEVAEEAPSAESSPDDQGSDQERAESQSEESEPAGSEEEESAPVEAFTDAVEPALASPDEEEPDEEEPVEEPAEEEPVEEEPVEEATAEEEPAEEKPVEEAPLDEEPVEADYVTTESELSSESAPAVSSFDTAETHWGRSRQHEDTATDLWEPGESETSSPFFTAEADAHKTWADTEPVDEEPDERLQPSSADEPALTKEADDSLSGELPELHAFPDGSEHKRLGLLTDADDLLGVEQEESSDGGVWRWFFYPTAIALLVIAILAVRYPDEADHLWESFQTRLGDYVDELVVGSKKSSGQSTKEPETKSLRDDKEPVSKAINSETDQPTKRVATATGKAPSGVEQQPETRTRTGSGPAPGQAPSKPNYLLTIDRQADDLAPQSQPVFAKLLQRLRSDSSLFVVLTGVSDSRPGSITGMREALAQAVLVSDLLVQQGVEQSRIAVEGRSSGQIGRSHTVEVKLRP